ncbi:MAG: histone deacetylase [Saprospiraceae bacterium]|nr:histone deacetylase [Saprospiraceae bacterium]
MLQIAYSPLYKYPLPEGHRFPMIKYELVPEQLLYEGTISQENIFHPESLDDDLIKLTHTADFLHKLNTLQLSPKEIRNIGFPMSELLVRRGKHIAGGTYQCALFAMEQGVSLNIAGGTHHSFADRGEGFCVFNDIAIAANILLHQHLAKKILIIDLDVHQGNGTASIFRNENRVFTFSMHGEKNYPVRKEQSDLDIGLPDKTGDSFYLSTIYDILPSLISSVKPDFAFYLSGVDILGTDKLGRLDVSLYGCKQRDMFVFELLHKNNIPVAVSMGGGYSPNIATIVEAHANTFRSAFRVYG